MNQDLQTDYDRVLQAFSAVAKLKSPLQQAFILSRTASFHGFPRAEFRRLYGLWLQEKAAKVVSFPGNDGGAA